MTARRQVFALLFTLGFPTLSTWVYFVVLSGRPEMGLAYAFGKIVQFAFPAVWLWVVERGRFSLFRPTRAGVASILTIGPG